MMLEYIENTAAQEQQRSAAAAYVRHHRELQALAAARIELAAARIVQRRRRHQTALMRPLVLEVGARVRISYLASSHVRQQSKVQLVKAFFPQYTREIYRVTARHLAPGSRRVVLYDVEAEGELLDGQQQPTRIVNTRVRLPLQMVGVDRRYLQPLAICSLSQQRTLCPRSRLDFRTHSLRSRCHSRAFGDRHRSRMARTITTTCTMIWSLP